MGRNGKDGSIPSSALILFFLRKEVGLKPAAVVARLNSGVFFMKRVIFFSVFAVIAVNFAFVLDLPGIPKVNRTIPQDGESEIVVTYNGYHPLPVILYVDGKPTAALGYSEATGIGETVRIIVPNGTHQIYLAVSLNPLIPEERATYKIDASKSVFQQWPGVPEVYTVNLQGQLLTIEFEADPIIAKLTSVGSPIINKLWDSGLYLGVLAFADQITHLSEPGSPFRLVKVPDSDYRTVQNKIQSDYKEAEIPGTSLYAAVHSALLDIKNIVAKDIVNLDTVSLVTFTDGIDNNSTALGLVDPLLTDAGNPYKGDVTDNYKAFVVNQLAQPISREILGDKTITAYSVGSKGQDVLPDLENQFKQSLRELASAEENFYYADDIEGLRAKFRELAQKLRGDINADLIVGTPSYARGTQVRVILDGKSATTSEKYIEGTVQIENYQYVLTNAIGVGVNITTDKVTGQIVNRTVVHYAFNNIGNYDPAEVQRNPIQQWFKESGKEWQRNSEIDKDPNAAAKVIPKSGIVYLILDNSTSLGSGGISEIQRDAREFITILFENIPSQN
ncbi:hypothetical protein PilKf_00392 [Pillotina sp. SPG140]